MWPFGRTIVLPSAREASVMSALGVTGLEFAEAKAIRDQTKELRMRVARALDHMVKAGKAEAWVYTTDDAEPTGERFTREAINTITVELIGLGYAVEDEAGSVGIAVALEQPKRYEEARLRLVK